MTEPERRPRPRAFRLDGEQTVTPQTKAAAAAEPRRLAPEIIEPEIDAYALEAMGLTQSLHDEEQATEAAQVSGVLGRMALSWGGLFFSSLMGLASLAAGLWVTGIVEDLFARSALLGMLGLILAGGLAIGALALFAREIHAMTRQHKIAKLHIAFAQARAGDDGMAARARLTQLCKLYENRPETGRARALLLDVSLQIVDGRDLIDLAERNLVQPLDEQARREIARAAKRVSVVTAVSPRAIIELVFVAGQAIALMRRIAEIYGGRPGLWGFFKLARSVGTHLAITGGMAVGDSILQQFVGHGIAARLSARLGEGVLNGLLTARVGLSAMSVCRPMPFATSKPPGVKDVAPFLFGGKTKS